MPDFHQPDDADRAEAEATGAAEGTTPGLRPESEALQERRPSSDNDPNAPDRPKT
jgi:hypothetical protein